MFNNNGGWIGQRNWRGSSMPQGIGGRENTNFQDRRNFMEKGDISNGFIGYNGRIRGFRGRGSYNCSPNFRGRGPFYDGINAGYLNYSTDDQPLYPGDDQLDTTNLHLRNKFSNQEQHCASSLNVNNHENSSLNATEPTTQSPDISSSTSPTNKLNTETEIHSTHMDKAQTSIKQFSIENAAKLENTSAFANSCNLPFEQLGTNLVEHSVSW